VVDCYAEEQLQLVKEMKSYIRWLKNQVHHLDGRIKQLSDEPETEAENDNVDIQGGYCINAKTSDGERRGCVAILNKQKVVCKGQLEAVCNLFRTALNVDNEEDCLDCSDIDTESEADDFDFVVDDFD